MSLIEQALQKMKTARETAAPIPVPPAALPVRPVESAPPPQARNVVSHRNVVGLDNAALTAAGVIVSAEKAHQQSSEYRHIKRQLLSSLRRDGERAASTDRLLMVASAISGEGKTFNSLNLSFSLARERDYSVLLIDADVAKPNISRLLKIETYPGLLDVARDESVDPEEYVIDTDLKGLSLMSAGAMTPNATEYLSSVRMQSILQRLASVPQRIVIIDSPPLLMTTESAALAQLVGRVVLIVRADSTPQRAVLDALDLLGDRPGVSLVLNQTTHLPLKGYYYGYNYQYGDAANTGANIDARN